MIKTLMTMYYVVKASQSVIGEETLDLNMVSQQLTLKNVKNWLFFKTFRTFYLQNKLTFLVS